ncbi:DinB family protein [Neobacillus mesonae]|nr:DinB family protein [Neobacillus mesonae]
MQVWFKHNWMLREQWYEWCQDIPHEELLKERTGGVGGILKTLFHIVDVEWSWIQVLQGKPDFQEDFENYNTLEQVRELDKRFREDIEDFVNSWDDSMERNPFYDERGDEQVDIDAWGEIMRHTIAHQIHHLGQISVWAREIGKQPLSPNVIGKGLIEPRIESKRSV